MASQERDGKPLSPSPAWCRVRKELTGRAPATSWSCWDGGVWGRCCRLRVKSLRVPCTPSFGAGRRRPTAEERKDILIFFCVGVKGERERRVLLLFTFVA